VTLSDGLPYNVTLSDGLPYNVTLSDGLPYNVILSDGLPYNVALCGRMTTLQCDSLKWISLQSDFVKDSHVI
jgi:hypothetical protein